MRWLRLVSLAVVLVAVGLLGYWAGREALEPPEDPIDEAPDYLIYTVGVDTVGRSVSFTAIGEWVVTPVGWTGGSGTVTSIDVAAGETVSAGDILYTLDLRPVVAAEGEVPMFRSLGLRSEGRDVAQLQTLLSTLGFFQGEVDGTFDASTRTAVRAWQDWLGVDDDGVVQPGAIVFMPSLPARIVLSESVTVGGRFGGGEEVVSVLPEAPRFHIPLAAEQAALVPLTADVVVQYAEGSWSGRIEHAVETEFDQLELVLTGPAGGSLCADACTEWVDLTSPTDFRANIIVIPETTGVAVPVAGISSNPGNSTFVTLADGAMIPVTILASGNGLAIVDGLAAGTEIRLPAEK